MPKKSRSHQRLTRLLGRFEEELRIRGIVLKPPVMGIADADLDLLVILLRKVLHVKCTRRSKAVPRRY